MGKTWKFTEQIYEELREAVDKKIETRFNRGVYEIMDNPFEKYLDEIDTGIIKMNNYVDRINDADGFNRAKLDRVFFQVAVTDRNYGNQIQKCTEDLEHYRSVLYQLELVMEQAAAGSSNGNVTFDFDRAAFQELVSEDKIAMDIAYVDRILDRDASEITAEDYERIAVLIGNQPYGNTALVEHILNSTYCWEFVDCLILEGQEMPKGGEGISSSGVFMPTEKYLNLLAALNFYAVNLSVNQPEDAVGTPYKGIMNRVICCEQLFSTLAICMQDRTYAYEIGQAEEMLHNNIGTMFQVRMGDTSVGEDGLLLTIAGGSAPVNIEVMGTFTPSAAIKALNDLQNTYINKYLQLDMTDGEVAQQSVMNSLAGGVKSQVMEQAIQAALGGASHTPVSTVAGIGMGVIKDVSDHHQKEDTIKKYETYGKQASAINVLGLNSAVTNYTNTYVEGSQAIITVYPRRETQERLDRLNEFLQGEGERFTDGVDMSGVPEGGFSVEYVTNHLAEVDVMLDKIEGNIRDDKDEYANSLLEAMGLE